MSVAASLNDSPFSDGSVLQSDLLSIPNASWQENFNSDAAAHGGTNIGNAGAAIASTSGWLELKLPASGLIVFVQQ